MNAFKAFPCFVLAAFFVALAVSHRHRPSNMTDRFNLQFEADPEFRRLVLLRIAATKAAFLVASIVLTVLGFLLLLN
jgi:hypothetical protein